MGTSALYGFKRNGVEKISVCDFDGYPWCLGVQLLTFCRNSDLEEMKSLFDRIEMAQPGESVDGKELLDLPWTDAASMSRAFEEWYMHDSSEEFDFLYVYVINLDTDRLERWDRDLDSDMFPANSASEVNLRDLADIDKALAEWSSWG